MIESALTFIGGAAVVALGFGGFRTKRKDETIQSLERLLAALKAEAEAESRRCGERIATLEGRVDALQSDFAATLARAIVEALPVAWERAEGR